MLNFDSSELVRQSFQTRWLLKSSGVGVVAYMGDFDVFMLPLTEVASKITHFLRTELAGFDVTAAKTHALPLFNHVLKAQEIEVFASISADIKRVEDMFCC